jgi:hypothetical protein
MICEALDDTTSVLFSLILRHGLQLEAPLHLSEYVCADGFMVLHGGLDLTQINPVAAQLERPYHNHFSFISFTLQLLLKTSYSFYES